MLLFQLKEIRLPNKMFVFSRVLFFWKFTVLTNLKGSKYVQMNAIVQFNYAAEMVFLNLAKQMQFLFKCLTDV